MKKKKLRVAIQGIATSFHEVAALSHFDEPIETIECLSFHVLCEALKNDRADYAMMAIENSIAGSILPNYFLLQEYHFSIVGELYQAQAKLFARKSFRERVSKSSLRLFESTGFGDVV